MYLKYLVPLIMFLQVVVETHRYGKHFNGTTIVHDDQNTKDHFYGFGLPILFFYKYAEFDGKLSEITQERVSKLSTCLKDHSLNLEIVLEHIFNLSPLNLGLVCTRVDVAYGCFEVFAQNWNISSLVLSDGESWSDVISVWLYNSKCFVEFYCENQERLLGKLILNLHNKRKWIKKKSIL